MRPHALLSIHWPPSWPRAARRRRPPPSPQTPEVSVLHAKAQVLPLTRDLVGRVSSVRSADVRARVPGILLRRLYREGSEVRAGQVLFQIDPKPYQAALDAALAGWPRRRRPPPTPRVNAKRTRDLLPSGLVSRSDVDNNNATERSSQAQVKQAEANVETARINLGYATVTRAHLRPLRTAARHRRGAGGPKRSDAAHDHRPDRPPVREFRPPGR